MKNKFFYSIPRTTNESKETVTNYIRHLDNTALGDLSTMIREWLHTQEDEQRQPVVSSTIYYQVYQQTRIHFTIWFFI